MLAARSAVQAFGTRPGRRSLRTVPRVPRRRFHSHPLQAPPVAAALVAMPRHVSAKTPLSSSSRKRAFGRKRKHAPEVREIPPKPEIALLIVVSG
jgi:hypothetical protein